MKNNQTPARPLRLSTDSQNRLLAYSTAAGLGAFFAGQNADGTLVQAPGLGPYPLVVVPQPVGSTNGTTHYLSIEGGAITNFSLIIFPDLLSHPTNQWPSQVIDLVGVVPDTNNPAVLNGQALAPLMGNGQTNAYIGAFFGGQIIGNNPNCTVPWYAQRLGISYNAGSYPWINYNWSEVPGFPQQFIGFKFTSSVDGQNHFGYLDLQVNFTKRSINYTDPLGNPATASKQVVESVVISDCRYETTPNADVVVPSAIKIIGFKQDPSLNNLITIDFGPNWPNDNTSTYVVETSPTLGPSATWAADPQALVYQTGTANADKPATYQAITYPAAGATSQFWRIRKQ